MLPRLSPPTRSTLWHLVALQSIFVPAIAVAGPDADLAEALVLGVPALIFFYTGIFAFGEAVKHHYAGQERIRPAILVTCGFVVGQALFLMRSGYQR